MRIIVFLLLISSNIFAQTKDTVRYPTGPEGKDTLLVITETIQRQGTYTYTYPETKVSNVVKPYVPPTTPIPPVVVPGKQEGFAVLATGGSNYSTVYHVTNTNSSGAGSFAAGIGSNKTIVFDISGTIPGGYTISGSNITIDGGNKEIIFRGGNDGLSLRGTNIILKNVYVTDCSNDGINVVGGRTIYISNVCSWSHGDGSIDIASGSDVTVAYSIMGPAKAGPMLITANKVSVKHNLFCSQQSNGLGERNPLVHSSYSTGFADVRGNVIWKWGREGGSGIGHGIASLYNGKVNAVNNFVYTDKSGGDYSMGITNMYDGQNTASKGNLYAAGNVSGNGVNANARNNSVEFIIPAANQLTVPSACESAKIVLSSAGPAFRNSTATSFINQVNLSYCK